MASYVITGTSRGIGLEFVRQLSANEQNTIFAIVRNKPGATRLIGLNAKNVHILEADITDHKVLKAAAEEVAKITGGTLDYLINNAATLGNERNVLTFSQYDDQDILAQDLKDAFNINVIGAVFATNAFLPLLRKGTTKKVITLSSGVCDPKFLLAAGYATSVSYGTSKAALNITVAMYAAEFKDEGFVFLALSPGLVDTNITPPPPEQLEIWNGQLKRFLRAEPNGKVLNPEESVRLQLDVINRWTVEDTGAFVSQHGNQQWM